MNTMESLAKDIDTLRESLENTLQNHSYSSIDQSHDEYLRRAIEFFDSSLQLIELIISLIETFAKDSKLMGDHFGLLENEKGWIEMRNIAERMQRRRSLLASSNYEEFLSNLMWFSQKGDESDLVLIEKVKNNPLYTSDEIIYLLNIIPSMISSRSSKVIDQTDNNALDIPRYRVHCSRDILETTFKNISILHEYTAFCIIAAPQNIIDVIRKLFPVDSFNIPAQKDSQGSSPMTTLARDQVIQFNAPILKTWMKSIGDMGGRILEPLGGSEIVVSIPTPEIFKQILNFPWVAQITPYQPKITVKLQDLLSHLPGTSNPHSSNGLPDRNEILPGILIADFFTTDDRNQSAENLEAQGIRVLDNPGQRKLILDLFSNSKVSEPLEPKVSESFELIIHQVGLRSLSEKTIPRSCNAPARAVIGKGVIPSNPTPTLGLTGKDQVIAICDDGLDTGNPDNIHLDFQGRVLSIQSYPIPLTYSERFENAGNDDGASDRITGHGTHVVGSALGNSTQAQQLGLDEHPSGMAPDAKLVFHAVGQTPIWKPIFNKLPKYGLYGIPDTLSDLFRSAYIQAARIYSISWTNEKTSAYDPLAEEVDRFVWENKDILFVICTGNVLEENRSSTPHILRLCSIGSPGTAKNCLTVGASENDRADQFTDQTYGKFFSGCFGSDPFNNDGMVDSIDDIAPFSGRGPCKGQADSTGIIPETHRKPDVLAPGTFVLSTRSSQVPKHVIGWGEYSPAKGYYMYNGGTSMATPLVAGSAALVREYLATKHQPPQNEPTAALVKAILIHSAVYINYRFAHPNSKRWADNEQGWGRVSLQEVLNPPAPKKVVFIDQRSGLSTGDKDVYKISIKDKSVPLKAHLVYTDPPGDSLINNLNLIVYTSNGQYCRGNDFDDTKVNDTTNNVEGVIIQSPVEDTWEIHVVASKVMYTFDDEIFDTQDYALVISGGGLELTSQERIQQRDPNA